jgi:hypothetical protein
MVVLGKQENQLKGRNPLKRRKRTPLKRRKRNPLKRRKELENPKLNKFIYFF